MDSNQGIIHLEKYQGVFLIMKKLRILFFVLVFVVAFGVALFQVNRVDPSISGSVSNFLPGSEYLSSEKDNNLEIWNYQYKDILFSVISETTVISEFDGQFESTHIETNYLHNLFQYHSDKIKELANNYGIGLYDLYSPEKEALKSFNAPMIYYDLRSDECYLYCFVGDKEDIHILFDFFGGVMIICEGYLPSGVNSICDSKILLNISDMGSLNKDAIVQSKEFYSEWVEFVNSLDIGLYREEVSNI